MDLFKPLYKLHRKGPVQKPFLDPDKPEHVDIYNVKTSEVLASPALQHGYQVYQLKAPEKYCELTVEQLPGLKIYRGMITPDLQTIMAVDSTTTYLSDPRHLTNLDAHHDLQRPINLLTGHTDKLTNAQLQKKLRWTTLGGQYNWTDKVYPSFTKGDKGFPEFPSQLAQFIQNVFGVRADAAIVNYYSEGDILSPHQDVAEQCHQDLISFSLGLPCIFYIGLDRYDKAPLPILLRSGDVLVMGGESRWAFHGVGRVFEEPSQINSEVPGFNDYIRTKRININVRQMTGEPGDST